MTLRDVNSLKPLAASKNPDFLGPNVPEDLVGVKRGSVALVVRKIGESQEVLLIKRSIDVRDRWSGHIAIPGGKQEKGESDLETAKRETLEEVGIDLDKVATLVGPLSPRLAKISWGRRIAMIICPYVFVINNGYEDVPLSPQISEVAAAFWYPLSALFDPKMHKFQEVPLGDRLGVNRLLSNFISRQTGPMYFDAIEIWPSASVLLSAHLPQPPWKMWGITLAIFQDFRKLIDPDFSLDMIRLPTFRSPDLNLLVTLFTGHNTRRKREFLRQNPKLSDLTNRMLDGHFTSFPLIIGTGIGIRVLVAAVFLKWLYSGLRGKL